MSNKQEPRILRLTLLKVWFEKFRDGEKREEHRQKKSYWRVRLFYPDGTPKKFSFVQFRNGYRPDSPRMAFRFLETVETATDFTIRVGERIY